MKWIGIGCLSIIGIIVLVLVVCGGSWMGAYNALNHGNQEQQRLWADIESTMQRRHDLIPNLVACVKGAAVHEEAVFVKVAEARASMGKVNINLARTDPAEMAKLKAAEAEMSGALSRLLVVAESHPKLKVNENFLALQSQLEGTENRINVARERYNKGAAAYNELIGSLFTGFVATCSGFRPAELYHADEGAKAAPVVKF